MTIARIGGEHVVPDLSASALSVPLSLAPVSAPEGAFAHAMRNLGREIDVGETRVAGASQLRSYDTGTLIALQAGIYRYSEAVDLASKIVDRASNAVRTVLQGSH